MSKIGILGGTFNPIHNGHLLLAEQARCFYGLDQVLFIPSGCSYMKWQEEILPGEIRFQMVQLAIADNPYFCVSDIAKVSVLADYFLIANGNNRNQVQAMADNVDEQLTKAGYSLKKHGRLSDRKLDPDGLRRSRRTCV